jgi:hypothetical protein
MTDKLSAHSNRRLPGKMHRWQRLSTFWLFSICFITGVVWFASLDMLHTPVTKLRFWWVLHGCSSLVVLLLIGAAFPHHVLVTWKAKRNVRHGILVIAGLLVMLLTALGLLYGPEEWHDALHWSHSVLGLAVAVLFPLHVWRGRKQSGH